MNTRQRTILNRLLDDFEGKLTAAKYAKLTKSSHDTALRDTKTLIDREPSSGKKPAAAVLVIGWQARGEAPSAKSCAFLSERSEMPQRGNIP